MAAHDSNTNNYSAPDLHNMHSARPNNDHQRESTGASAQVMLHASTSDPGLGSSGGSVYGSDVENEEPGRAQAQHGTHSTNSSYVGLPPAGRRTLAELDADSESSGGDSFYNMFLTSSTGRSLSQPEPNGCSDYSEGNSEADDQPNLRSTGGQGFGTDRSELSPAVSGFATPPRAASETIENDPQSERFFRRDVSTRPSSPLASRSNNAGPNHRGLGPSSAGGDSSALQQPF